VVTRNSYITAAGNCGKFDEARRAYHNVCDSHQADKVTHASYITAAGNCGEFDEARRAYGEACKSHKADVLTHNSYITAAGNCGEFDEAKHAYDAACHSRQADVVTHNSYITAAGDCGRFDGAKRAYGAACDSRQANVVTHASYITAAGNYGEFAEAKHVFDECAISFQYKEAGTITGAWLDIVMIDLRCFLCLHFLNEPNRKAFLSAYARHNKVFPFNDDTLEIVLYYRKNHTSLSNEQVTYLVQFMQYYGCDIENLRLEYALDIFYAQYPHLIQPQHDFAPLLYGTQCPVIDLHNYSKGEALLMCEIVFNQHRYPGATLICGKGLHSKYNKSVLVTTIEEFCKREGMLCRYAVHNSGRIICQRTEKDIWDSGASALGIA
jgi:hypothetical protein